MHEILNLFKQQPILKFQQKLINLKNPKHFPKTLILGQKIWKCMKIKD